MTSSDTLLSADELLLPLRLSAAARLRLLGLEQAVRSSEIKGDILADMERRAADDPWRVALETHLASVAQDMTAELKAIPASATPTLDVITGIPGAGKSVLWRKLNAMTNTPSFYLCGDTVKTRLKARIAEDSLLKNDARLTQDGLIHRLTSAVSWRLYALARTQHVPLTLEMIGTQPDEDLALLREAANAGMTVRLHHVTVRTSVALNNAARRCLGEGDDAGRHVPLRAIASQHRTTLESFCSMAKGIIQEDLNVSVRLYDNSQRNMSVLFSHEAGHTADTLPPLDFLMDLTSSKGLWHVGANPTADVALFSQNESGDWQVALIQRKNEPFAGHFALPGGFVNTEAGRGEAFIEGAETPEEAARREFEEETLAHLPDTLTLMPLGTFGEPGRDPRNTAKSWVVSHLFTARMETPLELHGSDDAEKAQWISLSDIDKGNIPMAFDHGKMLKMARETLCLAANNKPKNRA